MCPLTYTRSITVPFSFLFPADLSIKWEGITSGERSREKKGDYYVSRSFHLERDS